jgi:hypothetical protein
MWHSTTVLANDLLHQNWYPATGCDYTVVCDTLVHLLLLQYRGDWSRLVSYALLAWHIVPVLV